MNRAENCKNATSSADSAIMSPETSLFNSIYDPIAPRSPPNNQCNLPEPPSPFSSEPQPLRCHDAPKFCKPCAKELIMNESDVHRLISRLPYKCQLRGCLEYLFDRSEAMNHYICYHVLNSNAIKPTEIWRDEHVGLRFKIDDIRDNEDTLVGLFAYAGSRNGLKPADRFVSAPNVFLEKRFKHWRSNLLVLLFARKESLFPEPAKASPKLYVFRLAALPTHLSLKSSITIFNTSASEAVSGCINVDKLIQPLFCPPPRRDDVRFVVYDWHMKHLVEAQSGTVSMQVVLNESLEPAKI